jgi:hypothetical protein
MKFLLDTATLNLYIAKQEYRRYYESIHKSDESPFRSEPGQNHQVAATQEAVCLRAAMRLGN